jgi:hypothetical protein
LVVGEWPRVVVLDVGGIVFDAAEFRRREELLRGGSQMTAILKGKEFDGMVETGDGGRVAAILQ